MAPSIMERRKDRSKTGCASCLRRKIKCDEQHPMCQQCTKAKIQCSWDLVSRIHVQKSRRRCKEKPNLFSSSFLYPSSLPCGNSVVLSHHDRLYLEYFPNTSLVKVLGKAYTWSNFRYICQNKALEDPAVMYAVIALSASELYQSLSPVQAQDESRVYYSLALQRIADTVGSLTCDTNKIEAVLSALFLIIVYESRHGSYNSRVTTHTQNLVSCLTVCFRSVEPGSNGCNDLTSCPAFTPFCAQVLLWILYIESSCICGNISFGLMDHFYMSIGESQLHNLFTYARYSYLFIHGQQYPAEQQEDDLENYCPLMLIHQNYLFRYRIWRLAQRHHQDRPIQSELETLWREMNSTQSAFHDLFQLQKTPPKDFRHRRVFITLCESIAGYYCNILLVSCLFQYRVIPRESHGQALSELFNTCYIIHERHPADPTFGFVWHLLIAGLKTEDRIHREWAYNRLKDIGERWNKYQWAADMLCSMHKPDDNSEWWGNDNYFWRFIQNIF